MEAYGDQDAAAVADMEPAALPQGADAMLAADTQREGPDPNAVREDGPAVTEQIRKWIDEARVPAWMIANYQRWKDDQEYVGKTLFYDGDTNVMSVNLAARLIQAKLASIMPSDNDISIKHDRPVADAATVRKDAIRQANAQLQARGITLASLDPMMKAAVAAKLIEVADQAELDFQLELEARERFAATGEALTKKLHDEARGTIVTQDAALSTFTIGLSWAKIGWQEDYGRDSVGQFRNDDAQDQIALLALRTAEYKAGRFCAGDAKFDELQHLTRYAKEQGRKVLNGETDDLRLPLTQWAKLQDTRDGETAPPEWLPEPDRWQGVTLDNVNPWNLRWDWRQPFSKWEDGDWTMEQVPKDLDSAAAEYGLTPAEKDRIGSFLKDRQGEAPRAAVNLNKEDADPSTYNYESNVQGGKVIVWDRWEKKTRRHVVFIEGLDRYLIDEVPEVTTPWFYPYAGLGFNVLDGQMVPVSETRFMRKIIDAINQRLTDSQESLWASMKRYIVKKGAFKDGELEKLRGATPHDVIEMESPEEIKGTWQEISSDDWNPAKYQLDDLFRLLELVMGMSMAQLGVVDVANTATEASIAESRSQQQSARHGLILADFIQKIMTAQLHYEVTCMSEDTVKGLVGSAAYWPMPPTRLDLLRGMRLKVDAAGSRQQTRQREGEELQRTMATIGAIFGLKQQAMTIGENLDIQPLISRALRAGDVDASYRDLFGGKSPASMPMSGAPGLPGGPMPALPGPGGQPAPTGSAPGLPQPPNASAPPPPPVRNRAPSP